MKEKVGSHAKIDKKKFAQVDANTLTPRKMRGFESKFCIMELNNIMNPSFPLKLYLIFSQN